MEIRGKETLALVEKAKQISQQNETTANSSKLDIFYADEMPNAFEPPDELIEGVFVCGEGSVIYGASNTGKTFLAVDYACSVALGKNWMGRNVESGAVLYLAAESPQSIARRLQAYQKYHDVRIPHFGVVRNPVNLFDGQKDTYLIIDAIKEHEDKWGVPVRYLVGDTLSRLSAGANENAGVDMSIVIQHFDLIRTQTNAHFSLVHHSGKNVAYGARGWSGVRAAIDTEIEVTASGGLCMATITKQRELDSKGDTIYFQLEPVVMGKTKWGKDATSCVVKVADVPESTQQRQKLNKQQYHFWEKLAPLFKESRDFGKAEAPAMTPCIRFEDAVQHLIPYYMGSVADNRKRDCTIRVLRALVDKGRLMYKDNWLWDAPFPQS